MNRAVAGIAILVTAGWVFVAAQTLLDAGAPTGLKAALLVGCLSFAAYVALSLREG